MSVQSQLDYILSCQLPSGTFRLGAFDNRINPYFTNLALLPLLEYGEHEAIKQQLDWYLTHQNDDGYANDFIWQDGEEVDTRKADSEDSYPASFFLLSLAYVAASDDIEWAVENKDALVSVLDGLLALQQNDGLTWAKRSWKVKYLMDNCEVYQGLYAAEELFSLIGEESGAARAQEGAERCVQGIVNLYDDRQHAFAVYEQHLPNWNIWYPDATSQAFPILSGFLSPETSIADLLYQRLIEHFPRFERFETGDTYAWMTMGEWAYQMGDIERAARMTKAAEEIYIVGPRQPYWLIHDAASYIRLKRLLLPSERFSSISEIRY